MYNYSKLILITLIVILNSCDSDPCTEGPELFKLKECRIPTFNVSYLNHPDLAFHISEHWGFVATSEEDRFVLDGKFLVGGASLDTTLQIAIFDKDSNLLDVKGEEYKVVDGGNEGWIVDIEKSLKSLNKYVVLGLHKDKSDFFIFEIDGDGNQETTESVFSYIVDDFPTDVRELKLFNIDILDDSRYIVLGSLILNGGDESPLAVIIDKELNSITRLPIFNGNPSNAKYCSGFLANSGEIFISGYNNNKAIIAKYSDVNTTSLAELVYIESQEVENNPTKLLPIRGDNYLYIGVGKELASNYNDCLIEERMDLYNVNEGVRIVVGKNFENDNAYGGVNDERNNRAVVVAMDKSNINKNIVVYLINDYNTNLTEKREFDSYNNEIPFEIRRLENHDYGYAIATMTPGGGLSVYPRIIKTDEEGQTFLDFL